MIVASFLTKDLLVDWRKGEAFFRRHLADGDLASNNGGCSGRPAPAPTRSRSSGSSIPCSRPRARPEGLYVRRFLPELEAVKTAGRRRSTRRGSSPPPSGLPDPRRRPRGGPGPGPRGLQGHPDVTATRPSGCGRVAPPQEGGRGSRQAVKRGVRPPRRRGRAGCSGATRRPNGLDELVDREGTEIRAPPPGAGRSRVVSGQGENRVSAELVEHLAR